MSELGATSDPRALIPGSPEAIEQNVIVIRGRGESMIHAGEGLKRIDTGAWGGQAADAFRDKFSYEPPKWLTAGDSFDAASIALAGYAETLRWAQRQATEAIALWEQGEAATQQAQSQRTAAVAQANAQNLANAAAGDPAVVQVGTFSDPGEAVRQAARDMLDRARVPLAEAGDRAAEAIRAQTEGAPEESSWLDDVGGFFGDLGKGAWGSVSGFGGTLWDIIPIQAIWDPQGYTDGLATIAQGVAHNVTHPVDFLKGLAAWDTWSESPGRAIGEILGGAAIGGGIGKVAGKTGKVDRDYDGGTTDGGPDAPDHVPLRVADASATKPQVADAKLGNIIDNLYKGTENPDRVGDGTTADAVRYERETGDNVHGRSHSQKAEESIRALENWLRKNPEAPESDRLVAELEIVNLRDALGLK